MLTFRQTPAKDPFVTNVLQLTFFYYFTCNVIIFYYLYINKHKQHETNT